MPRREKLLINFQEVAKENWVLPVPYCDCGKPWRIVTVDIRVEGDHKVYTYIFECPYCEQRMKYTLRLPRFAKPAG